MSVTVPLEDYKENQVEEFEIEDGNETSSNIQSELESELIRKRKIVMTIFFIFIGIFFMILVVLVFQVNPGGMKEEEGDHSKGHNIQALLESKLKQSISTKSIKDTLQYYTSKAHVAGTIEDYETAIWTRDQWLKFGIPDVKIEEYSVLLTYPISSNVEGILQNGTSWNLKLKEDPFPQDPTSKLEEKFIPWNGYSAPGEVSGELIYANYGRKEDFEYLESIGLNVSQKIVIVRYGQSFRGNKVFNAEIRGALGVLIYSDPIDDGFSKGKVYPDGPFRPPSGIQRGSVWLGNGDPLTPGYAAIKDAPRFSLDEAFENEKMNDAPLPKIPVQPIGYDDAQPLLINLGGSKVPTSWQGGLDFQYSFGPGPIRVRMDLKVNYTIQPIWNVIGTIKGNEESDRYLLLGNHRDAWVYGAADPGSGSSVLNEVAKGYGKLLKEGWKPKRSIILCSWDGEEYGLIGSTEFVEQHLKTLQAQAIAYINTDIAVFGPGQFYPRGTPNLIEVIRYAAKAVDSPTGSGNIYDHWRNKSETPSFPGLGAGSDFAPFLQFPGVSCLDLRYISEIYGVYHSNYDSFHWITTYGDPGLKYHKAMAQVLGILGLYLSNVDILPFNYLEYSKSLRQFANSIKNRLKNENVPEEVDLEPLYQSIHHLETASKKILKEMKKMEKAKEPPSQLEIRKVNDRLMMAERGFIKDTKSFGPAHYLHVVYKPGRDDSYFSEAFPSIHEAITKRDWKESNSQIGQVSQAIHTVANILSSHFEFYS